MKIYSSLHAFFASIGLPVPEDTAITIHRLEGLHGDGPMKSPLFRTDYYTLVLVSDGRSSYTIDGSQFDLRAGSYYFTLPGHLKSFEIYEPLAGYLVTFSDAFIRQYFAGNFLQQFPFLAQETTPVISLQEEEVHEMSALLEQLLREYHRGSTTLAHRGSAALAHRGSTALAHRGSAALAQKEMPFRDPLLMSLLAAILYKTHHLLLIHQVGALPAANRREAIATAFRSLLNENFRQLAAGSEEKVRSVKEYAALLHLHPNYLSGLIKEATGKTPIEWIQERTLLEARSLLQNTDKTVSEIAHCLGFTDTAHLGKFLRKFTGRSATELRQGR